MNTAQFFKDIECLERGEPLLPEHTQEEKADLEIAGLLIQRTLQPTLTYQRTLHNHLLVMLDTQEEKIMRRNPFLNLFKIRFAKVVIPIFLVAVAIGLPLTASAAARAAASQWLRIGYQEVDNLFNIVGIQAPSLPEDANLQIMFMHSKPQAGDENSLSIGTVNISSSTEEVMQGKFTASFVTKVDGDEVATNIGEGEAGQSGKEETSPDTNVVELKKLTLEEVEQQMGTPVHQPAYLPQGYHFDFALLPPGMDLPKEGESDAGEAGLNSLTLHYANDQGDMFYITRNWGGKEKILDVQDAQVQAIGDSTSRESTKEETGDQPLELEMLVGKDSVREVSINNLSGLYVSGAWKADGSWDASAPQQTLLWNATDGTTYELLASTLTQGEIMHIAESVQ